MLMRAHTHTRSGVCGVTGTQWAVFGELGHRPFIAPLSHPAPLELFIRLPPLYLPPPTPPPDFYELSKPWQQLVCCRLGGLILFTLRQDSALLTGRWGI